MTRAALPVLLAAAAVLAGCGSQKSPEVQVARGDRTLAAPLAAATEFLRLDKTNAQRTAIEVRRPGEGGDRVTVVATLDGLPDDSVRAVRYVLIFERRGNGTWQRRSTVRTQRCWPHRGHQGFSAARCL